MVKNGNLELSGKEEAIRMLKINLTETKRQVELLRRNLKDKRATEQELTTLQIQVSHQNPHSFRFLLSLSFYRIMAGLCCSTLGL